MKYVQWSIATRISMCASESFFVKMTAIFFMRDFFTFLIDA